MTIYYIYIETVQITMSFELTFVQIYETLFYILFSETSE